VIVTSTGALSTQTEGGAAAATAAGGGARSCTARMPQEFAASQYSWKVHIVMSSFGSTPT